MLAGSTRSPKAGIGKIQSTVLVADDQASLVVLAHSHPGSLIISRHGIQQLDLKSVRQTNPLAALAALGLYRESDGGYGRQKENEVLHEIVK